MGQENCAAEIQVNIRLIILFLILIESLVWLSLVFCYYQNICCCIISVNLFTYWKIHRVKITFKCWNTEYTFNCKIKTENWNIDRMFYRVHSDLPNAQLSEFSTYRTKKKNCRKRHNDGGLWAVESLGAPFGRKPLLVLLLFYCWSLHIVKTTFWHIAHVANFWQIVIWHIFFVRSVKNSIQTIFWHIVIRHIARYPFYLSNLFSINKNLNSL